MRRAHTNEIRFICDFCGKGFKIKNDLKDHIKRHTSIESRQKFPCKVCNAELLSKAALKNHMILHSAIVEEHPCDCGKSFESRIKLYQHKATVHMKGNFPCHSCDKIYTVKGVLLKHIQKHHSLKQPCEVCGKLFAPGFFMSQHMKSHQPPGHTCSVEDCGKKFQSKAALVRHTESQHLPPVQVECPTCGIMYPSTQKLNRHIARQHSTYRVECNVEGCHHTASRKDYLRAHYRAHKDIDDETRAMLLAKVKDLKVISW